MSKTYNLVGGGNVEKAVLAVTVTNGTPTNVTATNGSKTVNLTRQSVLPSGYTQLEYIESTGTQYINTGVTAANDLSFEGEFYRFNEPESQDSPYTPYLFGVAKRVNGVYTRQQFKYGKGTAGITAWGTSFARASLDATSGNHVFTASGSAFTVDGVTWYVPQSTSFPNGGNIFLFAYNLPQEGSDMASAFSIFRYKRLTIWKNGTPIRNFKAAIRNSDYHVGFYDTVNNVFYDNAGTGSFIAGPEIPWTGNVTPGTWTVTATDGTNSGSISVTVDDVKVYSRIVGMSELGGDYTKLEWIYSDPDTAQIDTGYKPTTSCRLFGKFAYSIGHVGTRPFECEESDSSYRYYFNLICDSAGTAFYCGRRTLSSTQDPMTGWGVTSTNTDHTYSTSRRAITMDGVAHTVTEGSTFTVGVPNMYISKGVKTYYFQMTGTDGSTLVRDMIPAKRNLDSVVGMYDKVNGVFYSSRNEYVYTAGPAV